MKFRTTRKAIANESCCPMTFDVESVEHLFRFQSPIAYTCGVYGWNCDVYMFEGLTLTTGYRGLVGPRVIKADEYEAKAEALDEDRSLEWHERENKRTELLNGFIQENRKYYLEKMGA